MRVAILAHQVGETNGDLLAAWSALGLDAEVLAPAAAVDRLRQATSRL